MEQKIVRIEAESEDMIPTYETPGAACVDLKSAEDGYLEPGQTKVISCGFKVAIDPGWEMQIRGRSGLSLHGVRVANSPGTIDSDYRGDVGVVLHNSTHKRYYIQRGDRIAQACIQRTVRISFTPSVVNADTERGAGGFGSTGS